MDPRTRKSPARFLAPLALIVVIIVFLAIVSGGGSGGSSSSPADTSSTTTPAATTSTSSTKSAAKKKAAVVKAKRFYIVQTGDTLGAIATKTGIPLGTIQSLNPDVDPHSMTTGQKIRLR